MEMSIVLPTFERMYGRDDARSEQLSFVHPFGLKLPGLIDKGDGD